MTAAVRCAGSFRRRQAAVAHSERTGQTARAGRSVDRQRVGSAARAFYRPADVDHPQKRTGNHAMLLRRLAEALRRQDWFTVLIEFLIVVVGIFVGLQVSNWNEERVFANQEQAYLGRLHDEIAGNLRTLSHRATFTARVVEGGQRALAHLESGGACEPRCADLLVDLFHASQVWGTAQATTTADELRRLGLPRDLALRERIRPYYQYLSGWETVNQTPPPFRERVRGHLAPDVARILWQDCYEITEGQVERLLDGCTASLQGRADVADSMRRAAADDALPGQLRFWLVQNIYAMIHYPEMAGHAEDAIASIEAELGGAGSR